MIFSPIDLTFHVREYAFGERLIPDRLHKTGTPETGVVAETWEISDYRDTVGVVTRGMFKGKTLHELVEQYPNEIVGEGWEGPYFPLLAKFLDASHMLPVHLHASNMVAKEKYHEANGKTEAWHIVWAGEDATILAGVKPGLSDVELTEAFKAQDYDAVMFRHPIKAGDTVYVPGGALHSFGPDALVYEIQQTSDLGRTVMPNDLYGNPLPVEEWDANIAAVLDELENDYLPKPNPGLDRTSGASLITVGCASPFFALERWEVADVIRVKGNPRHAWLVSNIGNRPVTLRWGPGGGMGLARGASTLLPAAIGDWSAAPYFGAGTLIVSYVPDLETEIIAPLRAAGHSDEAIATLGPAFS